MSVRELVTNILREAVGDDWWESCVSTTIRTQCKNRQEDEAKHKFHTQRGEAPISYTDLKQLGNIIVRSGCTLRTSCRPPSGRPPSSTPSSVHET